MNWLRAYFNHVGIKEENGKFILTHSQLLELQRALGHEISRTFDPSGTVLVPEHLAHQMVKEHISKL